MRRDSDSRWVERLFSALTRLLAPDDRGAVGGQVAADVAREYRRRRSLDGRMAAWGFLLRQGADLLGNVAGTWLGARSIRRRVRTTRLEGIAQDLRIAIRSLLRRPALTAGAVLTLAVGIGVNMALLGVLYDVVLRPLPYDDPAGLVAIHTPWETRELGTTLGDIQALHRDAASLEAVAGALRPGMDNRMVIDGETGREPVEGVRVTPNFFTVLGVRPSLGPGVIASEPLEPIDPSVYLSHGSWLRRFGGDPEVIGRTMEVQRISHRVVGVLPADFDFRLGAVSPEIFVVRTPSELEAEDNSALTTMPIARLAQGADLELLQADLERIAPALEEMRDVGARGAGLRARTLRDELIGDVGGVVTALSVAGMLVFLVACANLATLFLARQSERTGEQALRSALGAGRSRLIGLPLLESLALGLAGGLAGVALAGVSTRVVTGTLPHMPFRFDGFDVGPLLVVGGVALSLLAGLLFGGLPAWLAGRARPADVLRRSDRRSAGGRTRATQLLLAAEATGLVVLLVATGLSLRSLHNLLNVDLGFEPEGRATATLLIPPDHASSREAFGAFLNRVDDALTALPEVEAAGTITHLPLEPDSWGGSLHVEGETPSDEPVATEWELASPGYFAAAGVRLLYGRGFRPSDDASSPPVTVVSRSLAERVRPGGAALGTRISDTGPEGPFREIVGIVEDVRQQGLSRPARPFIYIPHGQMFPFPERALVISARGDPMGALQVAKRVLLELDPDLAIADERPLEELVARASGSPRVVTTLLGVLGGASLLLALTGIYGVTSFVMEGRRRELGIRACLGASRSGLLAQALGSALGPVAAGTITGLSVVALVAPRFESLLFRTPALDPLTITVVSVGLLSAALGAAVRPARRVAGADPALVVREE